MGGYCRRWILYSSWHAYEQVTIVSPAQTLEQTLGKAHLPLHCWVTNNTCRTCADHHACNDRMRHTYCTSTIIQVSLVRPWPSTYIIFQNCLYWRNLGLVLGELFCILRERFCIFRECCCVRPDLFKNCGQQALVSFAAWVVMAKRSTCDKKKWEEKEGQRQLFFYSICKSFFRDQRYVSPCIHHRSLVLKLQTKSNAFQKFAFGQTMPHCGSL